jgi:hypothetical protein
VGAGPYWRHKELHHGWVVSTCMRCKIMCEEM